jgi:hypothetical protein
MIKRIIFVLTALFLAEIALADSDEKKYAVGFRFGGMTSGLTLRTMLSDAAALEGLITFGHKTVLLTMLYEKMMPVKNATGLKWFYGAGAHLGFFQHGGTYWVYKNRGHHIYYFQNKSSQVVPGFDLITGLDYTFKNAPINLSIDIKPFFDLFEGTEFYIDGAVSLRFVF